MSDVRDCQLVVMGPFGRVDLAHVTGFDSHQHTVSVRVDRIDGTQLVAEMPKGWEGVFRLERGSAAGDDFIRRVASGVMPSTLYQYVSAPDGGTNTYQYDGVVFSFPATADGDTSTWQTIEFSAKRRRRI